MMQNPVNLLAAGGDPFAAIIFFLILGIISALSQYQKWRQTKRAQQMRQAPPPAPPAPGCNFPTVPGAPRPKRLPPAGSPQAVRHPMQQRSLPHQRPAPTAKNTTIVRKPPKPPRVTTPVPAIPKPQMSGPRHAPAAPAAAPKPEDGAYAHSKASEALTARMHQGIGAAPAQPARPTTTLADARRYLKPNNLRKLFIVSELLAPPVGLRASERI